MIYNVKYTLKTKDSIMKKNKFLIGVFILLISCCGIFYSLTAKPIQNQRLQDNNNNKSYGAYLAGRVAHIRKDFDNASNFYIQALEKDPGNKDLIDRIYVILASQGKIDEASKYAQMSLEKADNNFTNTIIACEKIKHKEYEEAIKILDSLKGEIFTDLIVPLLKSWAYVGLNDQKKALKSLKTLDNKELRALYNFHAGMINEYFGNNQQAQKHYEIIINEEALEMSYRCLEVVSNFYLRTNQKDKAVALVNKYTDIKNLINMLSKLSQKVENHQNKNQSLLPLVNSANEGLSEALFNMAGTLRKTASAIDLSHVFISLSLYANPHYDLAKLLLADILENREMYKEANDVYDTIEEQSSSYSTARSKMATNLVMLKDYKGAELILKTLIFEDPFNWQLFIDLADVLRIQSKPQEAIKYYETGLIKSVGNNPNLWVIHFSLGACYDQIKNAEKSILHLQKALQLSNNNYMVQNYLGYIWIRDNKNLEQAFSLIADAFKKAPYDGDIADSLGWAYYKLGMYEDAVKFLEKATEQRPSNPVISNHLGDAYWMTNRQQEAVYQWKHSLKLTDETGELDTKQVEQKINKGLKKQVLPSFNKDIIRKKNLELQAVL